MTGGDLRRGAIACREDEPRSTRADGVADLIAGSLLGSLFVVMPVGLATALVYLLVQLIG